MCPDDIHHRSRRPLAPEASAAAGPDAAAYTLLGAGRTRAAAEEVIRAHGPDVHAYLLALLRDPDLADDAYSVWSEWTLGAIGRFQGASSLRTWAYGVAHDAARHVRNDGYRRRRCSVGGAAGGRLALPRGVGSGNERAAVLEAIRARLSPDDQGLLALRVEHGLAWDAISAILSGGDRVTSAALRKRFERVKRRIRRLARGAGAFE